MKVKDYKGIKDYMKKKKEEKIPSSPIQLK